MTKLLCPHNEGAGAPHPIRVGGPDLWYQMALVDTTVEQSLVSSAGGARGREGVLDVWLVGGVEGGGVRGVVVRPSSPRPPRRQHRGSMPDPVSSKTARRLQQRGATAGGEEDRVRRRGGSDGGSCVCEDR